MASYYISLPFNIFTQLRLLRSEISQAKADSIKASGNLARARKVVRRSIDEKWWPSVLVYLNLQARCTVNNFICRHKKGLKNFRQDRIDNENTWMIGQSESNMKHFCRSECVNFLVLHQIIQYETNSMKITSLRILIVFCLN